MDQPSELPRCSRRGVLSLVDGELLNYAYDTRVLQESTAAMRKRRRRSESAMAHHHQQQRSSSYNPSHSEWTLFFFGSSSNLNCLRFRPLLAEFCQNHPDKVQCICVPNGNDDEDLLPLGTGFYLLPWDHSNRIALLHLLAVTQIPTLVVVSNSDGRRITDRGMAAIESQTAPARIFGQWRQGKGPSVLASCIVT